MQQYKTPGVYRQDVFPTPGPELNTGVPVFLGYTNEGQINTPLMVTLWHHFEENFVPPSDGYLASAVRGFFENGGELCYVVRLHKLDKNVDPGDALGDGLAALESLDTIDLVCAPDIMQRLCTDNAMAKDQVLQMQAMILKHCQTCGDRFAILDSLAGASVNEVEAHPDSLRALGQNGDNGALYYPWLHVGQWSENNIAKYVPPCGHVAGVYARTDQRVGIHKAPANELLEGVLDLEINLTDSQQGILNPEGINCLRAFPGRGIRVWGARTLSDDPAWTYVNVRRLFLTAGRWIGRNMSETVFEPNDPGLWARIVRDLTAYFNELFRLGALKGNNVQEAFYIKCDVQTNSLEKRDAGEVITEIGLAPAVPGEFIVVRIIHGASGITFTGPSRSED